MRGVKWVLPDRALLTPEVNRRDIVKVVTTASTVSLDAPLPPASFEALAEALRGRPDTELALYGYSGWESLDASLHWLEPFSHLRSLSIAISTLKSIDGIERLPSLTSFAVARTARPISLDPLASVRQLTDLTVDVPRADMSVVASLTSLRRLNMSASRGSLHPLANHPTLERLRLSHGAERDLNPLASCRNLRDLSIWGIQKLASEDLEPIGDMPALEALVVGAARNVSSIQWLARSQVRYLELELLSGLTTIAPLAQCEQLLAATLFDSRPADKSLQPFIDAPRLEEVFIGGTSPFPGAEVDRLVDAFSDRRLRYRQRNVGPEDVSRLSWRGLFGFVDRIRADVAM